MSTYAAPIWTEDGPRWFGKYRGRVVSNDDETGRGRLEVEVPSVLGKVTQWALPCVPYAGSGVGFYSLPDPKTLVWIEFEAGHPSFPIWSGCFWGDNELPDDNDANIKIWKTKKVSARIDDSSDELSLEVSSGSSVTLSSDVSTESGGASHTVGATGVVSSKGLGKVDVNDAGIIVNNGAWGVK
jgi:hypothetical protein